MTNQEQANWATEEHKLLESYLQYPWSYLSAYKYFRKGPGVAKDSVNFNGCACLDPTKERVDVAHQNNNFIAQGYQK